MFYSISKLYSVQVEGLRWFACENETAVRKEIAFARSLNRGFRVVVRLFDCIEYQTHKFTSRFIWDGWGI